LSKDIQKCNENVKISGTANVKLPSLSNLRRKLTEQEKTTIVKNKKSCIINIR